MESISDPILALAATALQHNRRVVAIMILRDHSRTLSLRDARAIVDAMDVNMITPLDIELVNRYMHLRTEKTRLTAEINATWTRRNYEEQLAREEHIDANTYT